MIEAARRPELMGVTIRPAALKDVRAITRIRGNARKRYMPPYFEGGAKLNEIWIAENKLHGPHEVRERIRTATSDPKRNMASVATIHDERHDERVVGYIFGDTKRTDPDGTPEICRIADFGVRDHYTFRGIGGLLERNLYSWARDELGAQIDVDIPNTNWRALSFFDTRGYETEQEFALWPNDERWSVAAPLVRYQLHPKNATKYGSRRYPKPPPRPEWHEPRARWEEIREGQFHSTDDWGRHGSEVMQEDFMLNRADLLREKAEKGNRPYVRKLEAACYELLTQTPEQISNSNFVPIIGDKLIGVRDAALEEDDFIQELIAQRAVAMRKVHGIAQRLAQYGVIGQASGALSLPAVMINVDDMGHFQKLGLTTEDIKAALHEAPKWKASEHMFFFSNKDEAHDYRRYAIKASEELDMNLDEFLLRQQMHEGLHPIIDYFTDHWYGEFSTWLNEAFCDISAEFYQRSQNHLLKVDDIASLTIEDVMEAEKNSDLLKGGGYFLLKSIGLAVNPENMFDGIGIFMKDAFGPKIHDKDTGRSLNKAVLSHLDTTGLLPIVKQLFQAHMLYYANESGQDNTKFLIESLPLDLYKEAMKELRLTVNSNKDRRDDHGLYPGFAKLWNSLSAFSMSANEKAKMLFSLRDTLHKHPDSETSLQAYIVHNLIWWYHKIETGEAKLVRYEEGPDGTQRPVYEGRYSHEFRADYDPLPIAPRKPAYADLD